MGQIVFVLREPRNPQGRFTHYAAGRYCMQFSIGESGSVHLQANLAVQGRVWLETASSDFFKIEPFKLL